MKNYTKLLTILLVLFGLIFSSFPALAFSPTTGKVNTLARVRDSARFTKVFMVLAPNTPVLVTGEKGSWYQIKRKDGSLASLK